MIVDDVKALSVSKLDAAGRIAVPLIEELDGRDHIDIAWALVAAITALRECQRAMSIIDVSNVVRRELGS